LIGVAVILPLIFPLGLPLGVTQPSLDLYNKVESLKEGSVVLLTFDYYPSTLPETEPMSYAALRQLFKKNIRVVTVTTIPLGALSVMENVVKSVAREYDKKYGVDYVNLGYKYGYQAVMLGMGRKIADIFPSDAYGSKLETLPLMQSVKNYKDVDFIFIVSDNATVDYWVSLVNAQFGVPVSVGCTAVSAPKYYAYLRAGQMMSLLGGLKGASEYEKLVKDGYPSVGKIYEKPEEKKASATTGMDVQSIVHVIIIAFIVFGNVIFFATRKEGSK